MTWSLDPPIRVGKVAVAAIVETETSAHAVINSIVATSCKRPRVVLIAWSDEVEVIDMNGRDLDHGAVETLYPGAISRLIEQVR